MKHGQGHVPRWKLPRQVILLGWVSFFQDVPGEMVTCLRFAAHSVRQLKAKHELPPGRVVNRAAPHSFGPAAHRVVVSHDNAAAFTNVAPASRASSIFLKAPFFWHLQVGASSQKLRA
jgi:hypothetical protein